jgi:hypothetical protein
MIVVWFILAVLCIAVLFLGVLIMIDLIEFTLDHVNPIDICVVLERRGHYLVRIEIATVFCSLFAFRRAWPLLLIGAFVLWCLYRTRSPKGTLFDPLTVVRDLNELKVEYGIISALFFVRLLYSIVILILECFAR